MSSTATGRTFALRVLIVLAALCALGLVAIALSATTDTPAHSLKLFFTLALGLFCLAIAGFSIRTGGTGAGLVTFVDRAKNPIGFWLIVAFWIALGVVWVGFSVKELHASLVADMPNNSFKPNPLRGSA